MEGFHGSQYGRRALAESEYVPHDRLGYLRLLVERVPQADHTVLAYLGESLDTFERGSLIASTVMLGVAAERVFDLICTSLQSALISDKERKNLIDLQKRLSLKPKMEWVHMKLRALQDKRLDGYPENAAVMITGIYDMIRMQRNDLGHPREIPPQLRRGEAHANLLIFPRFYETAETVREFLVSHSV